jgi:hypothetical protein
MTRKGKKPVLPRVLQARLPAAAAGAAAICVGTASLSEIDAAIIRGTGAPLSITFGGPDVEWDVDGDGSSEFVLQTALSVSTSSSSRITYRYLQLNSHDGRNGRGFVQTRPTPRPGGGPPRPGGGPRPTPPNKNVQNLPLGFIVSSTFPAPYRWGVSGAASRAMISSIRSASGRSLSTGSSAIDFEDGVDGFAGFRFERADGIHYGWARLNLDLDTITLTIRDWAYQSTPDAAIAVGAVPEPGTSALALLAAGAAGVAVWRRRQWKEERASESGDEAR